MTNRRGSRWQSLLGATTDTGILELGIPGVPWASSNVRCTPCVYTPPAWRPTLASCFCVPMRVGGTTLKEWIEAELMRKRDELQRMQAAIAQLEALDSSAGGKGRMLEGVAEENEDDGEEYDEEYDDDEEGGERNSNSEPKTEEEWLAKLLGQQQELARA